jgi:hypothetical protein
VGIRYGRIDLKGRKEHPSLKLEVEAPGTVPAPADGRGGAHQKEDETELGDRTFHCPPPASHAAPPLLPMIPLSRDRGSPSKTPGSSIPDGGAVSQ